MTAVQGCTGMAKYVAVASLNLMLCLLHTERKDINFMGVKLLIKLYKFTITTTLILLEGHLKDIILWHAAIKHNY